MQTVVITAPIPMAGLEMLQATCQIRTHEGRAYTRAELLALLPEADGVIASAAFDAEMIAAATKLRIISNYGAGYDRVDIRAATAHGIPVTNIPDTVAPSTAELAFGLLLASSRRIAELDRRVRTDGAETCFGLGKRMGISLYGRKLGIVGMGNIGRRFAQLARAMDMQIFYYNRRPLDPELAQGATYLPLDTLLQTCDAITLHCPLTPETDHLIDARRIALLRPDCVLINTARGRVIDNDALADALAHGRIGAAGIDVYPEEPHIPAAYLGIERVVLTPHVGSNTVQARTEMAQAVAHRILEVFAGRRPPNLINPEIYG